MQTRWGIVLVIVSGILLVALLGRPTASSVGERGAILEVITKAAILPDRLYTTAKAHHRQGDLGSLRSSLEEAGKEELFALFTPELANKLMAVWVTAQFDNAARENTPEQVNHGVSHIRVRSLQVENGSASIEADVYKFLVDRVMVDNQRLHDRMEGRSLYRATLIQSEDGTWRISDLEKIPDIGSTTHSRTPVDRP